MTSVYNIKKYLQENQFSFILVFCALIFVGFVCSRALISTGIISLFCLALLAQNQDKSIISFLKKPVFAVFILYFLVLFFSYFWSEDKTSWLERVRIKLPFLVLPYSFSIFSFITKPQLKKILFLFALICSVSAVFVLANYGIHFEKITESIAHGSSIPMPYSHIRYNLLLVFSFFILLWLKEENWFWRNKNETYLQVFLSVFLFVTIHVLSVRSGWLALYLGMGLWSIFKTMQTRKYYLLLSVFLALFSFPFFGYKFVKSIHHKVDYMIYDFKNFKEGNVDDFSDGVRFASWKVGIEIAKNNFWLGTGAGDIQKVSKTYYPLFYPKVKLPTSFKMPHNEFIWIFATVGFIGFALFCGAFFFPLIYFAKQANWLWYILQLIFFTSFFTEYSLEEQIGGTFFCLLSLLFINYFLGQKNTTHE